MATPQRAHILTHEQVIHLLQAAQGHPLEAFVTLALTTGMRLGEPLALEWSDLDVERDVLHVKRTVLFAGGKPVVHHPKTKERQRTVPVPALVMGVLLRHRQDQQERRAQAGEQWHTQELIFCTPTGHFLSPERLLDDFHSLLTRAGLPKILLHDLRQTAHMQMRAKDSRKKG
jgi:integrase